MELVTEKMNELELIVEGCELEGQKKYNERRKYLDRESVFLKKIEQFYPRITLKEIEDVLGITKHNNFYYGLSKEVFVVGSLALASVFLIASTVALMVGSGGQTLGLAMMSCGPIGLMVKKSKESNRTLVSDWQYLSSYSQGPIPNSALLMVKEAKERLYSDVVAPYSSDNEFRIYYPASAELRDPVLVIQRNENIFFLCAWDVDKMELKRYMKKVEASLA